MELDFDKIVQRTEFGDDDGRDALPNKLRDKMLALHEDGQTEDSTGLREEGGRDERMNETLGTLAKPRSCAMRRFFCFWTTSISKAWATFFTCKERGVSQFKGKRKKKERVRDRR